MSGLPARRVADVYLPPGIFFAGEAPCTISTVLGSCVAVCMWSPRLRVGGMNHFLLPSRPETGESSPRYGDTAMELLAARVRVLGGGRDVVARIYGGAAVFARLSAHMSLGAQNVEAARRWLQRASIPVVDESVGGETARRVQMDVGTGEVLVTSVGGA
jgi:chemotaxis protein CheD